MEEALDEAKKDSEAFIIGGGVIYEIAMPFADRIYLTQIHHKFEGDTFFPEINMDEWNITDERFFEPDEKNRYPFTIYTLDRK